MRNGPDMKKFIEQASSCGFLLCLPTKGKKEAKGVAPKEAYYPTAELREYFRPVKGINFVDLKFYQKIISDHDKLDQFLTDLGVADVPRLCMRDIDPKDDEDLCRKKWAVGAKDHPESWKESEMDGYREGLEYVLKNHDKKYSQTLWNMMVAFIRKNKGKSDDLSKLFCVTHSYFSYGNREESFIPSTILHMRRKPWLVDKEGKFVSPMRTRSLHLDHGYDLLSREGRMLGQFIGLIEPSDKEILIEDLNRRALEICGDSFESLMKDPSKKKKFRGMA